MVKLHIVVPRRSSIKFTTWWFRESCKVFVKLWKNILFVQMFFTQVLVLEKIGNLYLFLWFRILIFLHTMHFLTVEKYQIKAVISSWSDVFKGWITTSRSWKAWSSAHIFSVKHSFLDWPKCHHLTVNFARESCLRFYIHHTRIKE